MNILKSVAALVAALALTSALADEQTYGATASYSVTTGPWLDTAYMEVWGVGSNSRYAQPATGPGDFYDYLIAGSANATLAAMWGVPFTGARWSYDPLAAPTHVVNGGHLAAYPMGAIEVTLGIGAGSSLLRSEANRMRLGTSTDGHDQVITFDTAAPTVDGPIAGSTYAYGAPAAAPFRVDLKDLLGPSAYWSSGFDLSAFAALPVRLAPPTVFRPVAMGLEFDRHSDTSTFGIQPPEVLSLSDFDIGFVYVLFDGVYGVSVDPADFGNSADYVAARDWVAANIRQINFEQTAFWQMQTVTAVPEPGPGALALAGLCLLAWRTRQRRPH